MNLPSDPFMLLSTVNMKLRDFYPSLDALCEDMGIEKNALCEKLSKAGFEYDEKHNKFCSQTKRKMVKFSKSYLIWVVLFSP